MADITDNIIQVFSDGRCSRVAVYVVNKANAGDTLDLSADLRVVKRAVMVSQTGSHVAQISAITSSTILTIPSGPSDDGVWILAVGVAK